RELKIDDRVLVKAPMGSCVFKDEGKKIAFLIGGIGITPVISIIEYITMNKIKSDVLLLYSNRFEEEIAFKKELDYWQAANPDIKICYLVSDGEPKDKACLHGRIDQGLLKNKASDLAQRTVFIFGPPKMVEAMQGLTQEAGCAKENIRIEKFIGY
ncbi:MAG: hypothetical protein KKE64_04705, partial [Candidatus Omnitrophica bacterium]|nr:hypothetical protein [Candidatus Omnitrophota bacterium]